MKTIMENDVWELAKLPKISLLSRSQTIVQFKRSDAHDKIMGILEVHYPELFNLRAVKNALISDFGWSTLDVNGMQTKSWHIDNFGVVNNYAASPLIPNSW